MLCTGNPIPPLQYRCRYVAASDDEGCLTALGSGTFAEFLRGGCVNLRSMRGFDLKQAEKANNEFARERRDALRDLLRSAAGKGLLPWGTTRIADFHADQAAVQPLAFIDLDEDLEGDSEFNPIVTG